MVSGVSGLTQYLLANRDLAKATEDYTKGSPTYQRAVDAFRTALPKIASVDDLLGNRQALTVALGAFGLEDEVDAKALVKKILTEDPSASTSLVNRLAETRWKQFAAAFGSLATDGGAAINAAGFADKIVSAFATGQFEESEGEQNESVREALYFQREASGATTLYQVLSDKTLGDVVRTTQGLPEEAGALDPDQQVEMLGRTGFDVSKLQDSAYVQKYVQRFLVLEDLKNPDLDPSGGVLALFGGDDTTGSGAAGLLSLIA